MIKRNETLCPYCGDELQYYDTVKRNVRTKRRKTKTINIRRLKCRNCGSFHRELPNSVFPYKQYESELILGVIEGLITCETLGYEDYPCEATMVRWRTQKLQLL